MSDYAPIYADGETPNITVSADVTGRQLIAVSGSNTAAATSGATAAVLGVAKFDAKSGTTVSYERGGVQEVVASGAITAGARVEAASAGKVASHTNGTNDYNAIGTALTTAADAALVRVQFDR